MLEFVILNLSDLHIQENNSRQESILTQLHEQLNVFLEVNIDWKPNFIILPGDIIDGGVVESFTKATKILNKIKEACSIEDDFYIIMTPGNHDKTREGINNEINYKKTVDGFKEFCNDSNKYIEPFSDIHKICFKGFNEFYKPYCQVDEIDSAKLCYIPYTLFSKKDLEYVTGIKVFKEEKICFLSLNTEWLSAEEELMSKMRIGTYKAGRNIVSNLTHEISSSYPDHFTVTLMHHGPDSLDWEEAYDTEPNQKEYVLGDILKCSELIVSGHEHGVATGAPDLLKNCVQHFRLGTPSCLPTGGINSGNAFPYSISLMRINRVKEDVALLRVSYKSASKEGGKRWDFEEGLMKTESYPLRNKYEKQIPRKKTMGRAVGVQIVRVRNYDVGEIEACIKRYLRHNNETLDNIKVIIQDIDKLNPKMIKNDDSEKQKMIHLVLYKKDNYNLQSEIEDGQEKFEKIVTEKTLDILLGRLVVSYMIIQKPYDYL